MRLVTWSLLVGLSAASVASGQPTVALIIAGLKALLVAREFMELKHAHPLHRRGFALATVALVVVLAAVTWPRPPGLPAADPKQHPHHHEEHRDDGDRHDVQGERPQPLGRQ